MKKTIENNIIEITKTTGPQGNLSDAVRRSGANFLDWVRVKVRARFNVRVSVKARVRIGLLKYKYS